jgi:hypothetical protein
VAVGVVGSAVSSNAASNAADQQSESAQAANMQQAMAAQQTRQDMAPWVETGRGANSLLSRYLGVGGVGSSGRTSLGLATGLSPTDLRNQLAGRFTTTTAGGAGQGSLNRINQNQYDRFAQTGPDAAGLNEFRNGLIQSQGGEIGYTRNGAGGAANGGENYSENPVYGNGPGSTSSVDEAALQQAMDQYYREQEAQNAQATSDPTYGSLLRAYRGGAEFDSGPAFSFTGQDVAKDPGYQFGLQQGQQGIDRAQASRGNFLSGAAIKEAGRFNSDYAGTRFDQAFNRASSTYGTNLSRRQNEWNTNLGAYNSNRNSIYNFLTGASATGQAAAAGVASNNQQVANSIGNNMMASGNAQAAGTVASGNAISSALNQGVNTYNSTTNPNSAVGWNNLLSRQGGGYSGYTGYTGGSNDPIANLNTQNGWTS